MNIIVLLFLAVMATSTTAQAAVEKQCEWNEKQQTFVCTYHYK